MAGGKNPENAKLFVTRRRFDTRLPIATRPVPVWLNSHRGVHDPGELFSIRIVMPFGMRPSFFPFRFSLQGADAMSCTKRSDAAGREERALTQVPMAPELANVDDV